MIISSTVCPPFFYHDIRVPLISATESGKANGESKKACADAQAFLRKDTKKLRFIRNKVAKHLRRRVSGFPPSRE
jgi:hypothetical protein